MKMKFYTLRKLTAIITVVLTVVFVLFVYLSHAIPYQWILPIMIPLFFGLVFYMIQYFLNHIIYDRLQPIYKIIRDVPVTEKRKIKDLERSKDILSDVNLEVKQWATDKIAEIERLRDLEKYRKDFLGNVSHELKTPIFNIQGYVLTLLDGGMDDPKINELYLERTSKSVDRMISIVEDLESINKLESGQLTLNKTNFDLVKMAYEVFDYESREATERNIKMEFTTPIDRALIVHADKKRLFMVLSNLVINALKYGKKGGHVRVGFFDMVDHILVEVSDNGIGIEKELLHRIFERFFRVDKGRSREQGGTGLGLSIVKHIIEAHEQTIQVKSKVDRGTTFTFTLDKAQK